MRTNKLLRVLSTTGLSDRLGLGNISTKTNEHRKLPWETSSTTGKKGYKRTSISAFFGLMVMGLRSSGAFHSWAAVRVSPIRPSSTIPRYGSTFISAGRKLAMPQVWRDLPAH
jgi:hypothetical protein